MTSRSLVAAAVLVAALTAPLVAGQKKDDPELLLQAAIHKEQVEGQLEQAIDLYKKVVALAAGNRILAARAQLRIGVCYEKLGKAEARKAYETVLRDYADQGEIVAEARARLAAMDQAAPPIKGTTLAVRQVWTGSGVDYLGAPSPDGRPLSFVHWETGNLAVRDLATGEIRRLTTDGSWTQDTRFAEFSVFSPDSTQIAYAWFNNTHYELRTVGLDGSKPRILYGNDELGFAHPAAWSKDGKQILALLTGTGATNKIAFVSVATGAVRLVKTLDWRWPNRMSLSPDGASIVYDFPPKEEEPGRDIYLLSSDGSREVALVKHPAHDLYPIWTPDGQQVLFLSDRTGTMAAWVQQVAGGKPVGPPTLVKPDMAHAFPIGFTAGGSFYYALELAMPDIYVGAIDPATGKMVQPPARATERFLGSNTAPDWSPDGRRLAYVSNRLPGPATGPGARALCILDVATGDVREFWPQLVYTQRPRWSPDGRLLMIIGQTKGRWGVYQVDVATGGFVEIVRMDAPGFVNSTAWSRDGKAIFYILAPGTGEGQRVARYDVQSRVEQEIDGSRGTKSDLAVSPDGRWLAFRATRPTENPSQSATILRVVPAEGGPARDLVPEGDPIAGFRGINWTPDGRYLLFVRVRVQDEKFELWRIPVDGGARRA